MSFFLPQEEKKQWIKYTRKTKQINQQKFKSTKLFYNKLRFKIYQKVYMGKSIESGQEHETFKLKTNLTFRGNKSF